MRLRAVIAFCIASIAAAAPIELPGAVATDFDAIVVGGGPSGLAALSALGRMRRRALLIDSGEYRNQHTRLVHDVAGFDGVPPAYLRWAVRQSISHYKTVQAINGTVTSIKSQADYSYFTVSTKRLNGSLATITARKIILATGIRDLIPQTPGLEENFARGIYWCPWCDGYEHADQSMGLLGPFNKAVENAAEVSSLNGDIIIFANGTDTAESRARADAEFADNSSAYLDRRGVKVDNRTITRIVRLRDGGNHDRDPALPTTPEFDLFRIEFDTPPSVERAVFFTAFESEQRSVLGQGLGVNLRDGKLVVDDDMKTNIPGIYAVGDANSDTRTNVLHAFHSGKAAAVHLHTELERDISRGLKYPKLSINTPPMAVMLTGVDPRVAALARAVLKQTLF